MLNKLHRMLREYEMTAPGDHVICAVSGGADSMALLFAMYLLRDKLGIRLSAAHFNHHLRGEESRRDEDFVKNFCDRYEIPLYLGGARVEAGKKGLEAAARDARYAYLRSLPGTVATAHTADDNAETVLMHLIRGTGLKGLGGIAPVNNGVIRPMLGITRDEVIDFLEEYHISYVEDSSNGSDRFLRNRIRHRVMPLLAEENPRIGENLSAMALRLREDEQALQELSGYTGDISVSALREMCPALRKRALERFLKDCGVREPEAEHIALAEALVFSGKPSAQADLPGGVTIGRNYDLLRKMEEDPQELPVELPCPGMVELKRLGLRVSCQMDQGQENLPESFTVDTYGTVVIRSRRSGDTMRLPGGTKSLKKLFIDRKIPAAHREKIPVVADDRGVLGVYGIGCNLDRAGTKVRIIFEKASTAFGCEK